MDKKYVIQIVMNNFLHDSRVLKESISLMNAGYQVTVIALHERDLPENDVLYGIEIHRIKLITRNWPKNKFFQIFKFLEFLYQIIKQYRHAYIFHCNDLDTLPIGVIIKTFFNKKAKVVYDAHEYETEQIYNQNIIIHWVMIKIEKYFIKYADSVITVSDGIANEYVKRYHIQKPNLIFNCPNYRKIQKKDIFREKLKIEEKKKIFLYQGGFSPSRGIELILNTFKKISNSNKIVVFMGYGPMQEMIADASAKYENIFYYKAVNPDILLDYTSSADFGLLLYENNCLNHYYCMPNKLFEYIMAGIPVIVSDLYEMENIVRNNKIGLILKENNINGFLNILNKSDYLNIVEIKKNIAELSCRFNWENQEKVLLETYKMLRSI